MFIKRILKICDLYGTRFHWYIGYKPKHYTYHGGIFSILTLIIWILLLAVLCMDDFKRAHPITSESTIPPRGYKNIKFGEKKLYIPWRIVDYDQKPLNIKGILYPKIFYYFSKYNDTTGKMDTNYTLINYKLCNETSMKYLGKEFLLDINLGELYCIDMEDLNMGGEWNTDFLNYIRLDLYLCENGIDYNETSDKCTSFDEIEKIIGKDNSLFFELLYPIVQFQPIEEEMPLLILYQAYYYCFTKYSNKLDRIYLREYILEDEQGWIFNNEKRKSYWGTYSLAGDNFVRDNNSDYVRRGSTSRLYSLKIYLNLGITYYTRKYKKIWEIISEIFPIIKIVIIFFAFVTESINEIHSTKKLHELLIGINQVLDNNNNKTSYNFNIIKEQKGKNLANIINNNNKNESKSQKIFNRQMSKINKNEDNNNGIQNGNDSNLVLKLKNNNNPMNEFSEYFDKNSSKVYKAERISYPMRYYFCEFISMKLRSKKNHFSSLPEGFRKSFSFFTRIIDISLYLKLFKNFENIKNIIMNQINKEQQTNFKRNDSILSIRKKKRKISAI